MCGSTLDCFAQRPIWAHFPVQREGRAADAVAVAANQGSEEAFAARFERGDVAVSDHHVVDAAVAVGDADAHHAAAVVDDLHRGAGSVAQTVQRDGLARGEGSERFGRNIGGAGCARGEKSRCEARTNSAEVHIHRLGFKQR